MGNYQDEQIFEAQLRQEENELMDNENTRTMSKQKSVLEKQWRVMDNGGSFFHIYCGDYPITSYLLKEEAHHIVRLHNASLKKGKK